MPSDPPSLCALRAHYHHAHSRTSFLPDHFKFGGYGPAVVSISVRVGAGWVTMAYVIVNKALYGS